MKFIQVQNLYRQDKNILLNLDQVVYISLNPISIEGNIVYSILLNCDESSNSVNVSSSDLQKILAALGFTMQ